MPYIAPETITQAKQVDLFSYLQSHEPQELVHHSGEVYTTKTHDSLKISNGKWMWWSRGIGGRTALDYLIKVKGLSFVEAVEQLVGGNISVSDNNISSPAKQTRLLLPRQNVNNDRVIEYLFGRGIDLEIINHCIDKGYVFESLPMHNAVFLGLDESDKPRYASYRGTGEKRYIGDASGSDKHYSFRMIGNLYDDVHLFESAIDLLSYATLLKLGGEDWRGQNLLSLAGIYQPQRDIHKSKIPKALEKYLKENNSVTRVVFHLDNDFAGREATKAISAVLPERYEKVSQPPPQGKDFNDFLCSKLGVNIQKQQERNER